MYDPKVGRWLSEDPIAFEARDANLYRYVGNAGTIYKDPSGLKQDDLTLPNITPDEQQVIDMAGDNEELRRKLIRIIQILREAHAPRWGNYETVQYGGRCVWWKIKTQERFLDEKARDWSSISGIKVDALWKYYIGWNPFFSEHHYL